MDDAQWRQYQSLSAEEQEVYAFALLTETEETVTATKKYFYTIAGEIEKLLQNGDEPQLEKLLPEVLKYFPEPQRTYCAMVHSLHDCLARTELIIARINEELGDGDTVLLAVNGEEIKLRLLEIDCFENKPNLRAKWQAETYGLTKTEVLHRGKQSAVVLKKLWRDNRAFFYVKLKGKDVYRR